MLGMLQKSPAEAVGAVAEQALPQRGKVLLELRSLLGRSEMSAGDPLPSERALAGRFGVDRKTIRRALKTLEEEGLIADGGDRRARIVGPRPNAAAVVLNKTVLFISDFELGLEDLHLSRGWDTHMYLFAMEHFHRQDLSVLAMHPDRFRAASAESIVALQPAGVMMFYGIAATQQGQAVLDACRDASIPVVVYCEPSECGECDRVNSDHEAGAYQLTRWLIAQGRRQILPFWRFPQMHEWLTARETGYLRAMREAGLKPLKPIRTPELPGFNWTMNNESSQNLDDLARVLLGFLFQPLQGPTPPDAIMVATDPHAYHVNAALRLLGRQPGEVAVVGYDNTWRDIIERDWEPVGPAATVDKQNDQIGRAMCELLLDRIAGKLPPEPQVRRVEPALVVCGE